MPVYKEEHRRNPTLQEICEALGTCEVDLVKCLSIQSSAISLSEKFKGTSMQGNDRTFEDILQSQSGLNPDLLSTSNQLNRDIRVAIERNLEKEEKDVLTMRLGLGNTRAHSISEVAKKYDLTWQKVRNLEKRALNKLLDSTDLSSTQNS
jgi:RNA polymerase primary sigma factor